MLLKNARRLVILCTAILLTNPLTLWLVGRINRLLGRPLCTMFVGYAASPKYREAYAFSFMLPWIRYRPMIVGLFIQNGRLGIIAMTSSVEPDFLSPLHLDRLHEGCHRIAERLGIDEVNFSGILPTVFRRAGLMSELHHQSRCRVVGGVVTDAAIRTADAHDIDAYLPIVLLGGRGSVGRAVATELGRRGRTCFIVDLNDRWPEHLRGERILLVDVSKRGALERRAPQLWEGVVVLNEAYPEPDASTVAALRARGIAVHHVCGVEATSLPPFPGAYAGGVPCCAAREDPGLRTVVKTLSGAPRRSAAKKTRRAA